MNGASSMRNVHRNIANLVKAIGAFICAEQSRYGGSSLGAQSSRRYILRKGRVRSGVFQKRAVKMYKEKIVEHA